MNPNQELELYDTEYQYQLGPLCECGACVSKQGESCNSCIFINEVE